MQAAFIVKIDIDQSADKATLAAELREDLEASGYAVIDVAPWASPNEAVEQVNDMLSNGMNLPFLQQPNQSESLF